MSAPALTKSLLRSYPNALSQFGVIATRILPFAIMVPGNYHLFKGFLWLSFTRDWSTGSSSDFLYCSVFLPKRRSLNSGFGPLNRYVNSLKITTVAIKCTLCFLCTQWDKSTLACLKRPCKQPSPGGSFFFYLLGCIQICDPEVKGSVSPTLILQPLQTSLFSCTLVVNEKVLFLFPLSCWIAEENGAKALEL